MEQSGWPPVWLIAVIVIVAFPVVFTGMWLAVVWLIAAIGGWRRVASRYAADGKPAGGRAFSGVNGMFGVANYKFALKGIVAKEGLYLETQTFFRAGHRPLLIPWSAIRNARRRSVLFYEYVSFDVDDPPLAHVRLPAKLLADAPIAIG